MTDYQMLRPDAATKDDGNFVRTLQGQTGTGFQQGTHVHKDWYAKTQSYEEGMEALEQGVAEREDISIARRTVTNILSHARPHVWSFLATISDFRYATVETCWEFANKGQRTRAGRPSAG